MFRVMTVLALALMLSGCTKKIEVVPVTTSLRLPPPAAACDAAIPLVERMKLNFVYRKVLREYKAGTPAQKEAIIRKYPGQIARLLDNLAANETALMSRAIRTKVAAARLRRAIKTCSAHVHRVQRLGG